LELLLASVFIHGTESKKDGQGQGCTLEPLWARVRLYSLAHTTARIFTFLYQLYFNGDSRDAGYKSQKKIQNPSHALLHTSSLPRFLDELRLIAPCRHLARILVIGETHNVLPVSELGSWKIRNEPHHTDGKRIAIKEKCKRRRFRAPCLQGDATCAR
jgi:hypothetical protein